MRVRVSQRGKESELELPAGATVSALALALQVPVDSAIFVIGDSPVPVDEVLSEGVLVRVVSSVSGG